MLLSLGQTRVLLYYSVYRQKWLLVLAFIFESGPQFEQFGIETSHFNMLSELLYLCSGDCEHAWCEEGR